VRHARGRFLVWYARGIGGEKQLSFAVLDALNEVGLDLVAAIGERGPASRNFHRGECRGAESQCQVPWQILGLEAKAADVVDGVVDANGLQQPDRYEVPRLV